MNWLVQLRFPALVLALGQAVNSLAVLANCPYHTITERNVFNLRPAPPPIDPPPPVPAPKVMPQIFITGITDVCGRRRALVEIIEPGKPSLKAVLVEGERAGPLEVVQIDVKQGQVKVNICGEESVLMLRAPPLNAAPSTRRFTL